MLSLKLRQKASQTDQKASQKDHHQIISESIRQTAKGVLRKVVIKGKVKRIKFDNNFVFRIRYYSVINIYPRNVKTLKKNYKKRITDIEEGCSVCDEQETSATENGMETHEKLFTTESELNIINKSRAKRKEIIVDNKG